MASDLKSDLVMTAFQRRPTVHLMGNPAVEERGVVLDRCLLSSTLKGIEKVCFFKNKVTSLYCSCSSFLCL